MRERMGSRAEMGRRLSEVAERQEDGRHSGCFLARVLRRALWVDFELHIVGAKVVGEPRLYISHRLGESGRLSVHTRRITAWSCNTYRFPKCSRAAYVRGTSRPWGFGVRLSPADKPVLFLEADQGSRIRDYAAWDLSFQALQGPEVRRMRCPRRSLETLMRA